MGFTMNGNTPLVVIAVLAIALIAAITVIAITGAASVQVFSDALIALVGAVGGGAAVHKASDVERQSTVNTVKDVVESAVGTAQEPK